jgi:hypothetical protein
MGVWSCLAITGDGSVNKPRVDLVDRVEVHAIFLQGPWDVVLDQDIAFCRQLMENLDPGRVLE